MMDAKLNGAVAAIVPIAFGCSAAHPPPAPPAPGPAPPPVELPVAYGNPDQLESDEAPSRGAEVACSPSAVIEDGEDNNPQIIVQGGRSGYWYTYADEGGTVIEPRAGSQGGRFTMSPGGANGSTSAARLHGRTGVGGGIFAGMGFNFVDPKNAYDASSYQGISFYARRGPENAAVRVKVPDRNTDPDGGVCAECFNDFGVDLELTETWTRYEVRFAEMKQQPGWGNPRPAEIVRAHLYGVLFQLTQPDTVFEIWVDDIVFTGCAGGQ